MRGTTILKLETSHVISLTENSGQYTAMKTLGNFQHTFIENYWTQFFLASVTACRPVLPEWDPQTTSKKSVQCEQETNDVEKKVFLELRWLIQNKITPKSR